MRFFEMFKKPVSVEIVAEGDERFLVATFAHGETKRELIIKTPNKKRSSNRPYWYWELGTGRRKFF